MHSLLPLSSPSSGPKVPATLWGMIGVNQELTAERHDPLESSCEAMLTMSRYISSLVNGQDASRRRLVLQLSPAYQGTIQQYEGRPIIITPYGSLSRPRSPFSVLRTRTSVRPGNDDISSFSQRHWSNIGSDPEQETQDDLPQKARNHATQER